MIGTETGRDLVRKDRLRRTGTQLRDGPQMLLLEAMVTRDVDLSRPDLSDVDASECDDHSSILHRSSVTGGFTERSAPVQP
jgi:hypothetical protein